MTSHPSHRPPGPGQRSAPTRRILFLDDDPARAELFLAEYPEAVWVQTVEECLLKLEEEWDEVHLDHDLGGEHFVDLGRDDCGMAIVRWLCLYPRPHLKPTKFFVHSHNPTAANMMSMQMMVSGYRVKCRPFSEEGWRRSSDDDSSGASAAPRRGGWMAALGRLFGLGGS